MGKRNQSRFDILIVDQSEESVERISALLAKARFFLPVIRSAGNMADALEIMRDQRVDLIILDIDDEATGGREALSNGAITTLDIPVIVISVNSEEQFALEAVFGGAQDHLIKDELTARSLDRAARYAVERHNLVKELRALSLVDSLTDLYNRRAFYTLGRQQLKIADRASSRLFLFFADLDNLKWVNDHAGHLAGDKMLAETAEILKTSFRESDLVARLGGDEFAIMAIEVGTSGPDSLLERIRKNIEEHNSRVDNPIEISLSIGVSVYDPNRPCAIDDLLERADRLMYLEKKMKKKLL